MPRPTSRAVFVLLAVAACRGHADTAEPAASVEPSPSATPDAAETPVVETAPEIDCSPPAVEAVLDERAKWTTEGRHCATELVAQCESGDGEACVNAGTIIASGIGGEPKDPARALAIETKACANGVGTACLVVAVMHEHGMGTPRDSAASRKALARACELGEERACKSMPAPEKPALVADANLQVGSIAADGLELRELACAVDGGMPLFGTLAIAATLAKQKKALDRCAPKGQAFTVTWSFDGGKVKQPVASGGTEKENKCIASAVGRATAPIEGRCGAVILVGDPANAAKTIVQQP